MLSEMLRLVESDNVWLVDSEKLNDLVTVPDRERLSDWLIDADKDMDIERETDLLAECVCEAVYDRETESLRLDVCEEEADVVADRDCEAEVLKEVVREREVVCDDVGVSDAEKDGLGLADFDADQLIEAVQEVDKEKDADVVDVPDSEYESDEEGVLEAVVVRERVWVGDSDSVVVVDSVRVGDRLVREIDIVVLSVGENVLDLELEDENEVEALFEMDRDDDDEAEAVMDGEAETVREPL